MEGLGIFVFIAYLVFALIGRAARERSGQPDAAGRARARQAARAREERLARAGLTRPEEGRDLGTSATQVEARRLEELLRGLGGLVEVPEEAAPEGEWGPGQPEEAYSLEGASLEGEARDGPLPPGDRRGESADDAAGALVQARIAAAEARSGALGPSDHVAFHRRLAATDAPAVLSRPAPRHRGGGLTLNELRRAVVWREILGPPVGLKEGHPGPGA